MKCLFCGSGSSKVIDKRAVLGTGEIRRRRECLRCNRRFTTYERLSQIELMVIKKDGHKELFNQEKLRNGILKALEKRPAVDKTEQLVEKIERCLRRKYANGVSSKVIGRMVLSELKKMDMVAYLRFASVYRQFNQAEDFAKEIKSLEAI